MNVSSPRNRTFHSEGDPRIYSRIRQIRRFESVRFFAQFPNIGMQAKLTSQRSLLNRSKRKVKGQLDPTSHPMGPVCQMGLDWTVSGLTC
jgi:hypothetical protein